MHASAQYHILRLKKKENETVCTKDYWVLYRLTDKLTFPFNLKSDGL